MRTAWVLAGLSLVVTSCGPRPLPPTRGCVRQVDCLGGERCDVAAGRCVFDDSSLDAGSCGIGPEGCVDDALNNRSLDCAAPVAQPFFRSGLVLCPATADYFRVDVPAGGLVEAFAWPVGAVNLGLFLQPPVGASVDDGDVSTLLAQVALGSSTAGRALLRVLAPERVDYAIKVNVGSPCLIDGDCAAGRCEPLIPDVLQARPTGEELLRGGHCLSTAASTCGDTSTEANRRTDALELATDGNPRSLQTCLDDVDWVRIVVPGAGAHLRLVLTCTSSDNAYRPHLSVLDDGGRLEWAEMPATFQSGVPINYFVPYLTGEGGGTGAGVHDVRLRQVAGLGEGSCTLSATLEGAVCASDGTCTGEAGAERFGRTRCSAQACVRP